MASAAAAPSAARCRSQRRSAPRCRGSAASSVRMVSASPGSPAAPTGRVRRRGPAATRSRWSSSAGPSSCHPRHHSGCRGPLLRLAAVTADRLTPPPAVGYRVRPGGCPGPADLPDLVLGGILGVVPGLLPDHAGVQHPPRKRGGRGRRSCGSPADQTDLQGAGVTGGCQSPPAAAAQMPARGVPTTRPRNVSTSHRREHAASTTSLATTASGLTRPATSAGRDRRHARSVGREPRDGRPGHRQPERWSG
jgi:hypothetical protein